MLDFLRRSATSFFAWLILGVLALVFGLSFGLPSDSITFGAAPLVKVHGNSIRDEDYRAQFNMIRAFVPIPKDERFQKLMGLKEEVLEAAVEREVLAHAADELGLVLTEVDAENLVIGGQAIVLGDTGLWLGNDMPYNYDIFTKNYLRNIQMSQKSYIEMQRKELLARTVRDIVHSGVTVSEEEVRRVYDSRANRLSVRYARFEPASFAELVDPSDEQIDAYVAEHRDTLHTQFESQGSRFTKLPKQSRLGLIEIPKGEDAAAARTLAGKALARIRGGENFRSVARELSAHETARGGGDYGWVTESSGSGLDPVVDETMTQLEPGEVSEVLEGESAWYVVTVFGRREGDVPEEEALRELAAEALAEAEGKVLARRAAEEALAALREGKGLDEVFATPEDDSTGDRVVLRETQMFAKGDTVPGLGPMPDLVDAAWASDPETPVVDRLFEAGNDIVLAGLASKESGTDEGFAEARPKLYEELASRKAGMVTARWAGRMCLEAKARGDIVATEDRIARVITYDTEPDPAGEQMRPYSVCDRVGNRGGLLRSGLIASEAE